jgi:hypothetical protein
LGKFWRAWLEWEVEPVSLRPDELKRMVSRGLATSDALTEAVEWLTAVMATGRKPAQEVHDRAAALHIPREVLYLAKEQMGVRKVYDGKARRWYWDPPPVELPFYADFIPPEMWPE